MVFHVPECLLSLLMQMKLWSWALGQNMSIRSEPALAQAQASALAQLWIIRIWKLVLIFNADCYSARIFCVQAQAWWSSVDMHEWNNSIWLDVSQLSCSFGFKIKECCPSRSEFVLFCFWMIIIINLYATVENDKKAWYTRNKLD